MTYPPQPPQDPWAGQPPVDPTYPQYGGYSGQPADPAAGYGQPPGDMPQQYPQQGYPDQPTGAPDPYAQPMSALPMSGQPMSGQPMSGQPWQPHQAAPAKSGPPVWAFVIGAVALVALVGVGVLVFVALGDDGSDEPERAGQSQEPSEEPSESESEDTGDGGDSLPDGFAVTNSATGLTYTEMGDPWEPAESRSVAGFNSADGQFLQTEFGAISWGAMVAIGELDVELLGYEGPDDLEATAEVLGDVIEAGHFNNADGEPLDGLARTDGPEFDEIDVDGRSGVRMANYLSWDDSDVEDTGEVVVVAAIDLGDGRAAGVFVGLPDSTPDEPYEMVDEALDAMYFE